MRRLNPRSKVDNGTVKFKYMRTPGANNEGKEGTLDNGNISSIRNTLGSSCQFAPSIALDVKMTTEQRNSGTCIPQEQTEEG